MLHFFYDSLDTLKKVKKPTRKEVRVFTGQVFIAVIVSSIIFFVYDNVRGNLYQQIFSLFGTPSAPVVQQVPLGTTNTLELPAIPTADAPVDDTATPPQVDVVPSEEAALEEEVPTE